MVKENVNIANLGDWGEARSGEFAGIGMDKLRIRSMEQSIGLPGVTEVNVTTTIGVSNTNSKTIAESFETQKSQSTPAEYEGRSLWQ